LVPRKKTLKDSRREVTTCRKAIRGGGEKNAKQPK